MPIVPIDDDRFVDGGPVERPLQQDDILTVRVIDIHDGESTIE